jgi:hypothetical protein
MAKTRSKASAKPAKAEKRSQSRVGYKQSQRIAPLMPGQRPSLDSFFEVPCHDMSMGGFSFVLDRVPDFSQLVVELKARDVTKYLVASVVNHRQSAKHDGSFVVGCKFAAQPEYAIDS